MELVRPAPCLVMIGDADELDGAPAPCVAMVRGDGRRRGAKIGEHRPLSAGRIHYFGRSIGQASGSYLAQVANHNKAERVLRREPSAFDSRSFLRTRGAGFAEFFGYHFEGQVAGRTMDTIRRAGPSSSLPEAIGYIHTHPSRGGASVDEDPRQTKRLGSGGRGGFVRPSS